MPEGPEVYILSKAINRFYKNDDFSQAIGKHLQLRERNEDWSFGLQGKVRLNERGELSKPSYAAFTTGYIKPIGECKELGLNWLISSEEEVLYEVEKWTKRKKKLAALLLDQELIAGIGVAWGSEILHSTGLDPNECVQKQKAGDLAKAIIEIRDFAKETYDSLLAGVKDEDLYNFINDWFENLYKERKMKVYRLGTKKEVSGRTWWV